MELRLAPALAERLERYRVGRGDSLEESTVHLLQEALALRGAVEGGPWQFVSSLLHEIRTPLATITMSAELVASATSGDARPEPGRYLRTLSNAADELVAVLDQAQLLARLESGRVRPRISDLSLAAVLGELRDHCERRRGEVGPRLSIRVAPELADEMRGDREQTVQVLFALVDHALASPRDDSATLDVSAEGTGTAVFAVGAPGPVGTGKRDPFRPFAERGSGTGLELPVARARAAVLGGSLVAEEETGLTRLVLRLPRHPEAAGAGRAGSAARPST